MKISKIIFLLLASFLFSCSDVFEEEIGKNQVVLITPRDTIYVQYDQIFWWQKVEGAIKYNLQIVEGSFMQPYRLVLDTNITSTKFTYSLSPGTFEWRVKGFNNSTETLYSTRKLTIDSSDISSQSVVLSAPVNTTYFDGKIHFSWSPLFGATKYLIEIDTTTGNFTGQILIKDTVLYANTDPISQFYNLNRNSGSFKWRVRGLSNNVASLYSKSEGFLLSNLPPVLDVPEEAFNVTFPVNLSWDPITGASSYFLHVKDSSNNYISGYPKAVNGSEYSFNHSGSNRLFRWAVGAKDDAGNSSDTSQYRSFRKQ